MIYHEQLTVTGTGGTVYTTQALAGLIERIKVKYTNGDAGGDVTITDDETAAAVLTLTNGNTDKDGPLQVAVMGNTGAAIANVYAKLAVAGRLKCVVADEAANSTVTIDVWWSR